MENFHRVSDVCNIYHEGRPRCTFPMHVTRNLCDRQRETGNPKRRKFPRQQLLPLVASVSNELGEPRSCLSSSTNVNSFLSLVNVSFGELLRLHFRQLAVALSLSLSLSLVTFVNTFPRLTRPNESRNPKGLGNSFNGLE